MITIGIDVGKFNHCACAMNHDTGELLVDPFFFNNNKEGFLKLFSSIKPFKDCIVGLEDTGHYGDNLLFFLLNEKFNVGLINPITTQNKRRSKLKTSKNDVMDSVLISKVLLDSEDYRLVTMDHYKRRQIRQLTRHHHDLKEDINVYKNRLQKNIDLVFPEYNSLFKSKYGTAYMAILKAFPSAVAISKADIRNLRKCLRTKNQGRRISLTAQQLKLAASNSIGEHSLASEISIRNLISQIELIETQIKEVDTKIEEYSLKLNSPIVSIPGISHFSGMSILSEYGDILRFASAAKLASFAGVCPYEYQSGTFKAQHTTITKKGSRYLRKVLYQVALPVIRSNPVFYDYYTLKRSQGKSHRCALGHVVRKLLRVIYHLVTNDILFDSSLIN